MVVKGEYGLNAEMGYQDKACAVGKAQFPVIKLSKYDFCCGFNIVGDFEGVDVAFIYPVHELDGGGTAASHFEKSVSLIEDIVRGVKNGLSFMKFCMKCFCFWVVLIVRNGEGAKSPGIYQFPNSPYRYLS